MNASVPARNAESAERIEHALCGDRAAMGAIVARAISVIEARVRSRVRRSIGPHEPRDLVQDVCLLLIKDGGRQLAAYDPSRGSLDLYVALIAERAISNLVQKERGTHKRAAGADAYSIDAAGHIASPEPTPEQNTQLRQICDRLSAQLQAELSPRDQAIVRSLYADELTPDQIARSLAIKRQTIYNVQRRLRSLAKNFREQLGLRGAL